MQTPAVTFTAAVLAVILATAPIAPATAHTIDTVKLARDNRAAVVSVIGRAEQRPSSPRRFDPFGDLFPFSPDFFERRQPRRAPRRASASGSGFLIDSQGYVLTNAHVIKDMDELTITLGDKSEYEAELIGSDQKTDIALLKITSDTPFPVVSIGDSDELQVGESVIAIGSPYGLDQSVTQGIVSALGRRLPSEDFVPFIQTDAAVNPGNSGGPLLNDRGEVVGINSQIISPVRSFVGVSFAIPINVAMEIQTKLREHGVVRRGRLGVLFSPVTEALADAYGLPDANGALIQDVVENSPAAAAELQSGDILTSFQGKKIEDAGDLPRLVGNTEPGTQVTLGIYRDGETFNTEVTLAAMGSDIPPAALLGLQVEDLTDDIRRRSNLQRGVVVTGIIRDDNTPADIAQLRKGDIITHVLIERRRRPVTDRDSLVALLGDVDDGTIVFYIWRNDRRLIVPVRLDQ